MASHLCYTLELICSAAFCGLTWRTPGPRQGLFNGAAGEVRPQRSGEVKDIACKQTRFGFFL